jgi:hypothetical integral membrane protein (TIGR02206 family)
MLQKHRKKIFIVLSVSLLWTQSARYIWNPNFVQGGFDVTEHLPFYICRFSGLVLLYYALTQDKRVESFLFFWGSTGLAGVLYANGPISNVVNLTETFYIDHFLLAVMPFFLVKVQGYKPIKKDAVIIAAVMFTLLVAFLPINHWLGSDYFYLEDKSIVGVLLPSISSFGFILIHSGVALLYFLGYYYMFRGTYQEVK